MRASSVPFSSVQNHALPPSSVQEAPGHFFLSFSPQAFAQAASRHVPLFLLIGPADAAFGDASVRAQLLERTVPVQLLPGERPDVELLCRRAGAALSGEGALPLCALLLENGLPFLAAPLPPSGFALDPSRLFIWLSHADRRFSQNPAAMHAQARDVLRTFDAPPMRKPYSAADAAHDLSRALFACEDTINGGFGKIKALHAPLLRFLQREAARGSHQAHSALSRTLDAMRASALHDPVDGLYFSSTLTEDWHVFVPEKPLVGNALLALTLLESGRRSEAIRILDALLECFSLPGGGFAGALSAPRSRYTFTPEQVIAQLGSEDGLRACRLLGLLHQQRASDPPVSPSRFSPPLPAHSARPSLDAPRKPLCPVLRETPVPEDEAFLRRALPRLKRARSARASEAPSAMSTTQASALGAAVFALCGKRLGETRYTQAAQRTVAYLLSFMPGDKPGALPPTSPRSGRPDMPTCGAAAALTLALLTLADGDGNSGCAVSGFRLLGSALHAFVREDGLVMHTPPGHSEIFPRVPAIFDGDDPSPAALLVLALKKAQALRPGVPYGEAVETIYLAAASSMKHEPLACASLIDAMNVE